ncbi:MAG: hypothetical protein OIF34_01865, partial [Porticoccaceae bacterium]|nr:hypothetical protein [Porticoccaceae bacterium]
DLSWLSFFIQAIYVTAIVGGSLTFTSWLYFRWRFFAMKRQQQNQVAVNGSSEKAVATKDASFVATGQVEFARD